MSPMLCGKIVALLISVQALASAVSPWANPIDEKQISVISVNTASDVADGDTSSVENLAASPGADGAVSLREAITAANNTPGPDSIIFQGAYIIEPATALPSLEDSSGGTRIDGAGQVSLRGAPAPAALNLTSAGNEIIGLTIIDSAEDGIRIDGAAASQNSIRGCQIGNDGTTAHPNAGHGIRIESAPENTIGGEAREDGNVISGNGGYGVYIGGNGIVLLNNLIGTDAAGAVALPNGISGVFVAGWNQEFGSAELRAGNVISGNALDGIELYNASECRIEHNRIGVARDGDSPVPNGRHGVNATGFDIRIGGTAPGAGNVIASNGGAGVYTDDDHAYHVAILQNSIYNNTSEGIQRSGYIPRINWILPNHGQYWVGGCVRENASLELFVDSGSQGRIPLEYVHHDDPRIKDGYFRVSLDLSSYEGMNLTVTRSEINGSDSDLKMNTSAFSTPFPIEFTPRTECPLACSDMCEESSIETDIADLVQLMITPLGGGYPGYSSPNILDSYEWVSAYGARYVEKILETPANPLHCCTAGVWAYNLTASQSVVDTIDPGNTYDPDRWERFKPRIVLFFAAITTANSRTGIETVREVLEDFEVTFDPLQFDLTLGQYFAHDGDADMDGVCNLAEFLAGGIANALDPTVTKNGGGCFAPCYEAADIGPDPCNSGIHSADRDTDGAISLSELLRLIQFFNSGGFTCAVDGTATEDGFVPEPGINASCCTHDSDYFGGGADWRIGLQELLRLIQFFNSGGYHHCPSDATEDGYCPGPVTR